MKAYDLRVFDDTISGSGTWFTPSSLAEAMAQADDLYVSAYVTDIGGSGPQLEVKLQTSIDGEHWDYLSGSIAQTLTAEAVYTQKFTNTGRLVRARVAFTAGSNPRCRLKLAVTGVSR